MEQWNIELTKFLLSKGFVQSKSDYSLFSRGSPGHLIHILVYVDDLLVTGDDKAIIIQLKAQLHVAFTIKDLGLVRYFLGIEISRSLVGTALNQRKFVLGHFTRFWYEWLQTSQISHAKGVKAFY